MAGMRRASRLRTGLAPRRLASGTALVAALFALALTTVRADDDDGWSTGHPDSVITDPDEIPPPDAQPRAHDEIEFPDAQPRSHDEIPFPDAKPHDPDEIPPDPGY